MKYIIMCGGNYNKFEKPKQLLKVNGEILVERTIRLLKENGITDIAISTNNPAFDYLDIEKLRHKNNYNYSDELRNKKSDNTWLNAYYPTEEPACYLHGDVYFSENAIKTIIDTKVKDTMFFCIPDIHDGRKNNNTKGREPLAYKVENQKVFRQAINDILQMVDEGKFKDGIEPISWHLYRKLNNLDLLCNAKGYDANNIFNTKGDYIAIDDYTTDIDFMKDIPELEKMIKIVEGGVQMIKAEVIEDFTLGRFNELKNINRASRSEDGRLFAKDTFECTKDLADYLLGDNSLKRAFIKVIEVIPEEVKEEKIEEIEEVKEEKPKKETTKTKLTKKTTTSKKGIAKK